MLSRGMTSGMAGMTWVVAGTVSNEEDHPVVISTTTNDDADASSAGVQAVARARAWNERGSVPPDDAHVSATPEIKDEHAPPSSLH